jgi:multidrug resistance efflux pump
MNPSGSSAERTTLRSPASGIVYQMLVTSGEIVERGDPVALIVDCATVFVTLSVTENVYDRLSSGDAATFRPRGSDKVFNGSIYRLAGSGASRVYEDLAIAPSEKHLERFDVTLEVPRLREDQELACAIGRTGRAYFDERPLDWLRNWFSFL